MGSLHPPTSGRNWTRWGQVPSFAPQWPWAGPGLCRAFWGKGSTHVDAYMDPGPLRNVLTTPRAFASIFTPGSGFPILLTLPPSSLGLSIPTAPRDLNLWGLVEHSSPRPFTKVAGNRGVKLWAPPFYPLPASRFLKK